MVMPQPQSRWRTSHLKWQTLRSDAHLYPSVSACAERCVPSLRACARFFSADTAGADDLVEDFLMSLYTDRPDREALRSPQGMTRAFEGFMRAHFGGSSRRIVLSSPPAHLANTWMTIDQFFDAISRP